MNTLLDDEDDEGCECPLCTAQLDGARDIRRCAECDGECCDACATLTTDHQVICSLCD